MSIVIRRAAITDLPTIVDLHVRSWRENYTQSLSSEFLRSIEVENNRIATWEKRLTNPVNEQYVIIAEVNGECAGFLCLYLDKHPQLGVLIDNLHVEPKFRKQGVGNCLMHNAATWINQQRPNSKIYLEAYAENKRAHKFYSGLAGVKTTEQPFSVTAVDGGTALSFHFTWGSPEILILACKLD